jgi:7,8-dihydroneopterin aldolase/epimerase/oxygenase
VTRQVRQSRIKLAGVKIYPRIGVTAEERSLPQECEADVTIWGNFEAAAGTDSLNKSIDYCQLLTAVQATSAEREYVLLETLGYRLARHLLGSYPLDRVRVRVRKRPAALAGSLDFIEFEIEES